MESKKFLNLVYIYCSGRNRQNSAKIKKLYYLTFLCRCKSAKPKIMIVNRMMILVKVNINYFNNGTKNLREKDRQGC